MLAAGRVLTFFLLIHQLFQVPLEKEGQLGGPILAQEEIKTIFGSIPDILDVHTKIKASCTFSFAGEAFIETLNVFCMCSVASAELDRYKLFLVLIPTLLNGGICLFLAAFHCRLLK